MTSGARTGGEQVLEHTPLSDRLQKILKFTAVKFKQRHAVLEGCQLTNRMNFKTLPTEFPFVITQYVFFLELSLEGG